MSAIDLTCPWCDEQMVKTGEMHPTVTPIYFYVCANGHYAKAADGQPLRFQ